MKFVQLGILLFLATLFSCQKNAASSTSTKPLVLVSVAPYQFIAERIGQDAIEVRSIVGSGANMHDFEPSPRQREALRSAEIWFRIGEPFENLLLPLFKDQWRIVDLRDGIDLLNLSQSDEQDRHMWMSLKVIKTQAFVIFNTLSERFPTLKAQFEANYQSLLLDLNSLDQDIHQKFEPLRHPVILVSHPAFGYYCRDYGIEQLSLEFEGKEPRPKHLEFIISETQKKCPNVAIALPQHNNKGVQMIAEELHLPIMMIDPYGLNYFEMMRTLTQWIVSHL